jgi:hypothetical protein
MKSKNISLVKDIQDVMQDVRFSLMLIHVVLWVMAAWPSEMFGILPHHNKVSGSNFKSICFEVILIDSSVWIIQFYCTTHNFLIQS